MKVRNGFVSNSSSSSFVVRGVKISKQKLAEALGLEELDDTYDIFKKPLITRNAGNYFTSDKDAYLIVGKKLMELDDGEVVAIKEYTEAQDIELKQLIDAATHGNIQLEDIKTYIQYVSNDNF